MTFYDVLPYLISAEFRAYPYLIYADILTPFIVLVADLADDADTQLDYRVALILEHWGQT